MAPTPYAPGATSLLAQRTNEERAVPLLHKIGSPDARVWWQGGAAYPLFESTLCFSSSHYKDQAGAQKGKIEAPTPMPFEAERGKRNVKGVYYPYYYYRLPLTYSDIKYIH